MLQNSLAENCDLDTVNKTLALDIFLQFKEKFNPKSRDNTVTIFFLDSICRELPPAGLNNYSISSTR